jgi:hypothetical protein
MWHPISTAPYDRDLELPVIDQDGEHTLSFRAVEQAHTPGSMP